jgi:hypothetical protein
MSSTLRALDPNDHLVSTSHAFFPNDPNVWNNGGLDLTSLHFYSKFGAGPPLLPDLAADVVNFTRTRSDATGKPVLFAELGTDSRGPAETRAGDPEGIGVHLGLWSGIVSGGVGTAMTWWWDNLIDPEGERYYPMFGAAARFVAGVPFDTDHLTRAEIPTTGERPVVAYALEGRSNLLLWAKDAAFNWTTPDRPPTRVSVRLPAGATRWCGQWYDTWQGGWTERVRAPGGSTVTSPTFTGDVALRAQHC